MHSSSSRQAYLDWLRILAIIGVLVFHSAMPFATGEDWHIRNKESSNLLLEFNFWLSRFRMPLLFFISGSVSYYMLKKKTVGGFIALRFRRLFIPLLFGMLVVVPPQIYMERLTQGYQGSYWDFYPSVFEMKPYPQGNTSWHHLWFILYLMVYDILFAPFFKWIVGENGQRFLVRCNGLAKGCWIYILVIPSVCWFTAMNLKYPGTNDLFHDYCRLVYWLLFLLVGFICIAHAPFMESLERNRRLSFAIAFVSIIGLNYVRWNGWEALEETYVYTAVSATTAWAWVFTAVGYGKRYLNKKHRVLDYVNQAVYPFYILHQTVIVILAYYVVQVSESILAKYLFIVIVTFAVSMAIYHLFIRPFGITRFLFGIKPRQKTQKEIVTPALPNIVTY